MLSPLATHKPPSTELDNKILHTIPSSRDRQEPFRCLEVCKGPLVPTFLVETTPRPSLISGLCTRGLWSSKEQRCLWRVVFYLGILWYPL